MFSALRGDELGVFVALELSLFAFTPLLANDSAANACGGASGAACNGRTMHACLVFAALLTLPLSVAFLVHAALSLPWFIEFMVLAFSFSFTLGTQPRLSLQGPQPSPGPQTSLQSLFPR